jgi:hypothetical protein
MVLRLAVVVAVASAAVTDGGEGESIPHIDCISFYLSNYKLQSKYIYGSEIQDLC